MKNWCKRLILAVIAFGISLGITIFLSSVTGKEGDIMANESGNTTSRFVKDLDITVTYDNNPFKEGLETAWGFSCVIRGTEKTILFDTGGNGSILLANMKKLSIHPEDIGLVVLSHIHGDHVGGLPAFLEKNHEVTFYLPKSFPTSFKNDVKKYGADLVEVQEPMQICEHVYSSGELGGQIREQSLFIQTDKGSIVITGCAHPGIVKIVQKAKDVLKEEVLFVMGGFHLGGESKRRLESIVSDFRKLGVKYVGPCHCSGDTARQVFQKAYQNKFIPVGVGTVITLEDLP
jgi:7,8-dihydropterin-6-yl-methyl-4-(beta-D-ribofuranosyl)aminobenzene 5'-phosphate synthase